jgi:type II secretory pathway pseudopilin PulG
MGFRIGASRRGEEGFTLVELLISILVSMVVLGAVSATFIVQNKSFSSQEQVVNAQEHARAALQLMTKELLMAGYDPTGSADAGIEVAESDTVQFTMDTDGDQSFTGSERIVYALDTTENQVTRNGQPIAENIEALTFTYFDSDGAELSSLPLSDSDKERVTRVAVEVTPIMPQSAGFKHGEGDENLIRLAQAGAVQAWAFVTDVLAPDALAASNRKLKDSVSPPNLGKTRSGADTGGGSGSGVGGGTGYDSKQNAIWTTDSASSS